MSAFGPGKGGLAIEFEQISERIPQTVVERILEERAGGASVDGSFRRI
jgi:hypothetical protein